MSIPLPENEWQLQFARSSGPGGQNVNKTNTKVILKWNIHNSNLYTERVKQKIYKNNANMINESGELVIISQEFRSQSQNKEACIKKLRDIIFQAHKKEKIRKKTKPTRASVKKRLDNKTKRSDTKKTRKKVDY